MKIMSAQIPADIVDAVISGHGRDDSELRRELDALRRHGAVVTGP
jgi:hypothetical protein